MTQIVRTPPNFEPGALDGCTMHVVLVHPQIPQNTGNIARLCAGSRAWLHLVEPLGFTLEDRYLKRAGLDYWPGVRLSVHESLDDFEALLGSTRPTVFTKRALGLHRAREYGANSVLVFGCETSGLPPDFVARHHEQAVRIPTSSNVRSLNLSNSVAIGVYEVLSQLDWRGEEPQADR